MHLEHLFAFYEKITARWWQLQSRSDDVKVKH
jgi:hypothetical protein